MKILSIRPTSCLAARSGVSGGLQWRSPGHPELRLTSNTDRGWTGISGTEANARAATLARVDLRRIAGRLRRENGGPGTVRLGARRGRERRDDE